MALFSPSTLPLSAQVYSQLQPGDFLDCYRCKSPLTVQQAAKVAFAMPGWAKWLMRLRNALVRPLGLKTGSKTQPLTPSAFPVTFETPTELQMGLDDSHLNFRITLIRKDDEIYMSTWVHVNNLLGRLYLTVIMPFHLLIVRSGMAQLARHSAAQQ